MRCWTKKIMAAAGALVVDYEDCPLRGDLRRDDIGAEAAADIADRIRRWEAAPSDVRDAAAAILLSRPSWMVGNTLAINGHALPYGILPVRDALTVVSGSIDWLALVDDPHEVIKVSAAVLRSLSSAGYDVADVEPDDLISAWQVDAQELPRLALKLSSLLVHPEFRGHPGVIGASLALARGVRRREWGWLTPDDVRDLRKGAGLSQTALAEALLPAPFTRKPLRQSTVQRWEAGAIWIDAGTAQRIVEACAPRITDAALLARFA